MTCCRVVADDFCYLPQKNAVLDVSVADVADVAEFFISIRKEEREEGEYGRITRVWVKSAATSASSATDRIQSLIFCGRPSKSAATGLPHLKAGTP